MMDDLKPRMSTHDRGAFGALLAEAKDLGETQLAFYVNLTANAESEHRWEVSGEECGAHGRTGEEALRAMVERLRMRP